MRRSLVFTWVQFSFTEYLYSCLGEKVYNPAHYYEKKPLPSQQGLYSMRMRCHPRQLRDFKGTSDLLPFNLCLHLSPPLSLLPRTLPHPLIFPLYRKLRRKNFCFVITEYFKIWNSLGSFSLYSINLFVLPGSKHAGVLQEASGRKENIREDIHILLSSYFGPSPLSLSRRLGQASSSPDIKRRKSKRAQR